MLFANGWALPIRISILIAATMTCSVAASATPEPVGEAAAESVWDRNLRLMFRRNEPREFARVPEDQYEYAAQGNGFYSQIAVTTVLQVADRALTDRDSLLNVAYDFAGSWLTIPGTAPDRGGISWWFRGGRPVGESRNANLSEDIGSILDVNSSLEDKELHLVELYWADGIGDHVRYSLGWIDSGWRYDFNSVANDDRESFISASLVNSPGIPFPTRGLAADLLWEPTDTIDVHAGLYQSNCSSKNSLCVDDFDLDKMFLPVEVSFKVDVNGWGEGNYRLLAYYTRTDQQSGIGYSLSLDQQFGRFTSFLRWSVGESEITSIKRFLSFGVSFDQPLGRPHDQLGLGFSTGETSSPAPDDEKLVELFWRFRVNQFVAVTPHVQLVVDPANNPIDDRIALLGCRLQLSF